MGNHIGIPVLIVRTSIPLPLATGSKILSQRPGNWGADYGLAGTADGERTDERARTHTRTDRRTHTHQSLDTHAHAHSVKH